MANNGDRHDWWPLHLKKARGEKLTDEEQRLYDAEMAKLDESEALNADIDALRKMRSEVISIAEQNDDLRLRAADLQAEIQRIEKSLNKKTRDLLGVED